MAEDFKIFGKVELGGDVAKQAAAIRKKIKTQLSTLKINFDVKAVADDAKAIKNIYEGLNTSLSTGMRANITALVRIRRSFKKFRASIRRTSGDVRELRGLLNFHNQVADKVTKGTVAKSKEARALFGSAAAGAAKSTKASEESLKFFGKGTLRRLISFSQFTLASQAVIGLREALEETIRIIISFDDQLIKLQQILNKTGPSVKSIADEVFRLGAAFGVGAEGLLESTTTLAQAGLGLQKVKALLRPIALTELAPTFENVQKTTEGVVAIINQFRLLNSTDISGDIEKSLDVVNELAKNFAVESGDLIEAVRKAGGVFANSAGDLDRFGVSTERNIERFKQFSALITTVRSTTRESATTIATGLRTISARLQRTRTSELIKDQLGVDIRDNGQFVGVFEALERISGALESFPQTSATFSKVIEEISGIRQRRNIEPILTNFDRVREALKVADQAEGSLADDAAKAQQRLSVEIAKTRKELIKLVTEIGGSNEFRELAKGVLELVRNFAKLTSTLKPLIPVLLLFTATKGVNLLSGGGKLKTATLLSTLIAPSFFNRGGEVPSLLTPGELVLKPDMVKKIGLRNLENLNNRHKFGFGGIVPGTGNTDTFPADLEPGSFVLNKKASQEYLSRKKLQRGGFVGAASSFFALFGRRGRRGAPLLDPTAIDSRPRLEGRNSKIDQAIANALDGLAEPLKKFGRTVNGIVEEIESDTQRKIESRQKPETPRRAAARRRLNDRRLRNTLSSKNLAFALGAVAGIDQIVPEGTNAKIFSRGALGGASGGLAASALGAGPAGIAVAATLGAGIAIDKQIAQQRRNRIQKQIEEFSTNIKNSIEKDDTQGALRGIGAKSSAAVQLRQLEQTDIFSRAASSAAGRERASLRGISTLDLFNFKAARLKQEEIEKADLEALINNLVTGEGLVQKELFKNVFADPNRPLSRTTNQIDEFLSRQSDEFQDRVFGVLQASLIEGFSEKDFQKASELFSRGLIDNNFDVNKAFSAIVRSPQFRDRLFNRKGILDEVAKKLREQEKDVSNVLIFDDFVASVEKVVTNLGALDNLLTTRFNEINDQLNFAATGNVASLINRSDSAIFASPSAFSASRVDRAIVNLLPALSNNESLNRVRQEAAGFSIAGSNFATRRDSLSKALRTRILPKNRIAAERGLAATQAKLRNPDLDGLTRDALEGSVREQLQIIRNNPPLSTDDKVNIFLKGLADDLRQNRAKSQLEQNNDRLLEGLFGKDGVVSDKGGLTRLDQAVLDSIEKTLKDADTPAQAIVSGELDKTLKEAIEKALEVPKELNKLVMSFDEKISKLIDSAGQARANILGQRGTLATTSAGFRSTRLQLSTGRSNISGLNASLQALGVGGLSVGEIAGRRTNTLQQIQSVKARLDSIRGSDTTLVEQQELGAELVKLRSEAENYTNALKKLASDTSEYNRVLNEVRETEALKAKGRNSNLSFLASDPVTRFKRLEDLAALQDALQNGLSNTNFAFNARAARGLAAFRAQNPQAGDQVEQRLLDSLPLGSQGFVRGDFIRLSRGFGTEQQEKQLRAAEKVVLDAQRELINIEERKLQIFDQGINQLLEDFSTNVKRALEGRQILTDDMDRLGNSQELFAEKVGVFQKSVEAFQDAKVSLEGNLNVNLKLENNNEFNQALASEINEKLAPMIEEKVVEIANRILGQA